MNFVPDQEPSEATLTFREQSDGRKVSRLPGGKVVLVHLLEMDRVGDGESWRVRLEHRDTFAIATPIEAVAGFSNPALARGLSGVVEQRKPSEPDAERPPSPAAEVRRETLVETPSEEPSTIAELLEVSPPSSIEPRRILRPADRVALFVDGANMDGAARSAGYFVDYRKIRDYLIGDASFYAAYYYLADFTASDPMQQRYMDFLSHVGYIIRKKPVKVITDAETGEQIFKGNLDTEIVLDMLNTVSNYDVAFLLSGDSDFERAVELLRSRGKRVYIVTSRRSLSRELAYVADKPIFFLEDLRTELARAGRSVSVVASS